MKFKKYTKMKVFLSTILLVLCGITTNANANYDHWALANDTTKKAAVHLKKDGTKDMRFKTSKHPVKKDGTPDMRFKSNKVTVKKDTAKKM